MGPRRWKALVGDECARVARGGELQAADRDRAMGGTPQLQQELLHAEQRCRDDNDRRRWRSDWCAVIVCGFGQLHLPPQPEGAIEAAMGPRELAGGNAEERQGEHRNDDQLARQPSRPHVSTDDRDKKLFTLDTTAHSRAVWVPRQPITLPMPEIGVRLAPGWHCLPAH
jgi:hypothetical protein